MRKMMIALTGLAIAAASGQAQIVQFDLIGKAGPGLLSGNENHAINGTPGTGGEVGQGIFYDIGTRLLTINIGWGSGQGFTNLTGNATVGHIHGPTNSGGAASFTQNAGVRYGLDNLPGWNNSATNGGFIGSVTINQNDVQALFDGRFYINIHTSANGPGEIRGNLIPTPGALGLLGVAGLAAARRRRA